MWLQNIGARNMFVTRFKNKPEKHRLEAVTSRC